MKTFDEWLRELYGEDDEDYWTRADMKAAWDASTVYTLDPTDTGQIFIDEVEYYSDINHDYNS